MCRQSQLVQSTAVLKVQSESQGKLSVWSAQAKNTSIRSILHKSSRLNGLASRHGHHEEGHILAKKCFSESEQGKGRGGGLCVAHSTAAGPDAFNAHSHAIQGWFRIFAAENGAIDTRGVTGSAPSIESVALVALLYFFTLVASRALDVSEVGFPCKFGPLWK